MTLPGFAAQHSLYKSSTIYRSYSGRGQSSGVVAEEDVIEPAFVCNPAKYQSCLLDNQIPYSFRPVACSFEYRDCSSFNGRECSGSGESAQCVSSGYVNCGGVACPLGAQACCDDVCCAVGEICCGGVCCSPDSSCDEACANSTSDQCCIDGLCVTHPQPDQLGSTGNNNYVLRSPGCQPIEGLTVSMQVQEQNLTGLNGFSMQLNAYNPQPITSQCPTNWMQFILANYSGQLRASVQYSVKGQQFNPFQWLALTDAYGKPVSNQNPMQIGQKLTISLAYDNQHKNITGANFLVTEANGETVLGRAYVPAPPSCLYKMLAFQVNIVAAPATHQPEFSGSTGTRGTITYRTSGQQLCNEGASVGSTIFPDPCSGTWVETLETINVGYGAMSSCCGSELSQPFLSTST
jgi:hypothetical protein